MQMWTKAGKELEAAITADAVDREIASPASRLRFSPAIEALYDAETGPAQLRQLLLAGLAGLVLYDSFLFADMLLMPRLFTVALFIRFLVVTPSALVLFGLMTVTKRSAYRNAFASLASVIAVAAMAYLLYLDGGSGRDTYNFSILLTLIYIGLIQRIRFAQLLPAIVAINLIFVTVLFLTRDTTFQIAMASGMIVIVGSILILYAVYQGEHDRRQLYLAMLRQRLHVIEWQSISNLDPLTGLLNRRALDSHLIELARIGKDSPRDYALILFDLDHFKLLNDSFGHPSGDRCLKVIADVVLSVLEGTSARAFRYGGEEFLVLMVEGGRDGAQQMAEALRQAIVKQAIRHPASPLGPVVTASFGVAGGRLPDDRPATLIADADAALYLAKNHGRNCVWPSQAA